MVVMADILEQPDFSLDIQDNGRLHIVVLPLTKSSHDLVRAIAGHLRTLPPFQPHDHKQNDGVLSLRILTELPCWSRDEKHKSEGILNGSKRLFGLFGVAHCRDVHDLTNATTIYKDIQTRISNPLMTTRCFVYGEVEKLSDELKGREHFVMMNYSSDNVVSCSADKLLNVLTHCIAVVHSNLKIMLINSQSLKKTGSLSKSYDGGSLTDDQVKHQRAHSLKAQADTYLLLGQYGVAMKLYSNAYQLLRHLKSYLWMGAALEGLISAQLLQANQYDCVLSLSVALDDHNTPPSNQDGLQDKSFLVEDSTDLVEQNKSLFSTTSNSLLSGADERDGSFSTVDGGSTTEIDVSFTDGLSIKGEDKIDKDFQLALNNYNRADSYGRKPLAELYIKYAAYLVQQKSFIKACEMLEEAQNVDDIDANIFSSVRLSLYLALSALYKQMNFNRKAIFMIVNAARQAIARPESAVKHGNLKIKAHALLKYCLTGFEISDSGERRQTNKGWPLLQATLLTEYIFLCKQLGYHELVIRWGWLLLQSFHSQLSHKVLKAVTDSITEAADHFKLKQGHVTEAPFPLTSVPRIVVFKPQPLTPLLTAKQSVTLFPSLLQSSISEGPFLVSMIGKSRNKESDILWVQGDPAEVLLMVSNPLSIELKVEKMTMLLKGAKVNAYPSNISLPHKCDPQEFVLLCIPSEPGTVSLSGYSATLLGLSNKSIFSNQNTVKVLPSLPQLRAKVFPRTSADSSSSSMVGRFSPFVRRRSLSSVDYFELLDGETIDCEFQLQSIGDVAIECIKVTIKEQSCDYCQFSWNDEILKSLFPLSQKNKVYSFPLKVDVNIPTYLRIGSCKVLHQGAHVLFFFSRDSLTSEAPKKVDGSPKSKTLRPNSTSYSNQIDSSRISSTSIFTSPQRLKRFRGSFNRQNDKHEITKANKSDLLESLDLPNIHPVRSRTLGRLNENHVEPLDENSELQIRHDSSSSPRSSKILKRLGTKSPHTVQELAKSTRSSSPIEIPDVRLMDSLNLEQTLTASLNAKKMADTHLSPDMSTFVETDVVSDTTSDIVNFDMSTADRVSIKSDPGGALSDTISSSPTPSSPSIKTSTSSFFSLKELKPSFLESQQDKKHSSLKGLSKKKRVEPQSSLPTSAKSVTLKAQVNKIPPVVISQPTGAQKIRRAPPGKKTIKVSFLMQYTGGEGAKEGYYREVPVEVTATVKPTLVFDDFSVSAVKGSPDLFSFDMAIENVSPYPLSVSITIKQDDLPKKQHTWDMEKDTFREISLPMKRFTLPNQDKFIKEIGNIKRYCERIVELIKIKWTCLEQTKSGALSLSGLQLPQSSLAIIRPLPIIFNIKTQAKLYSPGIPVVLTVDIINITGDMLPSSLITLAPFTLSPTGQKEDPIKQKRVLYSQSLFQRIPQLPIEGTHSFSLTLVFLYPNEYLIDVSHHMPLVSDPRPGIKTNVSSQKAENPLPEVSQDDDISPTRDELCTEPDLVSEPLKQSTPERILKANTLKEVMVSPVLPLVNTGNTSHSGSYHPTPVTHITYSTSYSDEIPVKEFISKSRTYVGPQLTINIT